MSRGRVSGEAATYLGKLRAQGLLERARERLNSGGGWDRLRQSPRAFSGELFSAPYGCG